MESINRLGNEQKSIMKPAYASSESQFDSLKKDSFGIHKKVLSKGYILRIAEGTVLALVLQLLILLIRSEVLYNRTGIAGTYNVPTLLLLACVGVAVCLGSNLRFSKLDFARFVFCAVLIVWGASRYSLIYGMLFFLVAIWDKIRFNDLANFSRAIIVMGFICTYLFGDGSRSTGFCYSAPMYAYSLCLASTYLLFADKQKRLGAINTLLLIVAAIQIWSAETRLFMVYFAVVVVYRFSGSVVDRVLGSSKHAKVMRVLVIAIIVAVCAVSIDQLQQLFSRDGGASSNETRMGLYENLIPQIIQSPFTLLFGHGGGYAMAYTAAASTYQGNLPVHQDFLLYLTDYGIVGLSLIAFLFFCNRSWTWYMWLLLVLCTFHNVATSGLAILLLFMYFQCLSDRLRVGDSK